MKCEKKKKNGGRDGERKGRVLNPEKKKKNLFGERKISNVSPIFVGNLNNNKNSTPQKKLNTGSGGGADGFFIIGFWPQCKIEKKKIFYFFYPAIQQFIVIFVRLTNDLFFFF